MLSYKKLLKLEGHEEGGYFGVFYKSLDKVIPLSKRYTSSEKDSPIEKSIERHAGSSIFFLLEKQGYSAWHRLKSDEIWHYYDGGSPVDIYVIEENGQLKTHVLGNPNITNDASFQVVIKAGVWFAAEVRDKTSFGLMGCTVSPGFEYNDFELAESKRDELVNLYPPLTNIIDKFIKPGNIEKSEGNSKQLVEGRQNKLSADDYLQKFKMERHQEGGYFKVNYVATDLVVPCDSRYKTNMENKKEEGSTINDRKASTSIYFLLNKDDFSAWHKLKSDEVWHYYDGGSPIDIHIIDHQGRRKKSILGHPFHTENASFQVVIKAGEWFAAEVRDKSSFGLVGCTVSPGFEYNDFILAERNQLISQFPEHKDIISTFTRLRPVNSTKWTTNALSYTAFAFVASLGLYAMTKDTETFKACVNNFKMKLGI